MTLRRYQPEDVKAIATLFYEAVHTTNSGAYPAAQLDA